MRVFREKQYRYEGIHTHTKGRGGTLFFNVSGHAAPLWGDIRLKLITVCAPNADVRPTAQPVRTRLTELAPYIRQL